MHKRLNIRKPVASLEAEAMSEEEFSHQVGEHASQSVILEKDIDGEIEEDSAMVASLEHRIEQLTLIQSMAGKPINSFEQIQLGLALGYSAVQNTDLNVHDDVLGVSKSSFESSFESSGTITFSAESIGQSIKDMAKGAGEKLAQAGRWLLELCKKIINLFKNKEGRVKNLKQLISDAKKDSKAGNGAKIRLTGSQSQNIGSVDDFILLTSRFEKLTNANDKYVNVCDVAEKWIKKIHDIAKSVNNGGISFYFGDPAKELVEAIRKVHQFYFETFGTVMNESEDKTKVGKTEFIGRKQLVFTVGDFKDYESTDTKSVEADATKHLLNTFKMVIETNEKDKDKELVVDVMSISDLEHLVTALEKAVAGKLLDLSKIEKLSAHGMWRLLGVTKSEGSNAMRVAMGAVNRSIIQPQGRFMSVYQSVMDDYLRFGERCAKVHLKGEGEADPAKDVKDGEFIPATGDAVATV